MMKLDDRLQTKHNIMHSLQQIIKGQSSAFCMHLHDFFVLIGTVI